MDKRTLNDILPDKKGFLAQHTESIIKISGGNLELAVKNAYKIHASNPTLFKEIAAIIKIHKYDK